MSILEILFCFFSIEKMRKKEMIEFWNEYGDPLPSVASIGNCMNVT